MFNAVVILAFCIFAPAQAMTQNGMRLLTPETGWIVHGGRLLWTGDGGNDWKDITPIPPSFESAPLPPDNIAAIFFLDTLHGWAVLSKLDRVTDNWDFQLARTDDGGQTWLFAPLRYPELPQSEQEALAGPSDMYFLDSLHGWMVMVMSGSSNFAPGKLLATEDGGRTWNWVNNPGTIGTLLFTTTQDGWLAGGPGGMRLYVTHDGCKTWREVNLIPPPQAGAVAYPAFEGPPVFTDNRKAFIAVHYEGAAGTQSKLVVFSTTDGGTTWKPAKILPESERGGSFPVSLSDSNLFVPTGSDEGKVAVAAVKLAGGVMSSVVVSRTSAIALSFAGSDNGWALNTQGKLLATTDGGVTWKDVTPWHMPKLAVAPGTPAPKKPSIQIQVTHPPT